MATRRLRPEAADTAFDKRMRGDRLTRALVDRLFDAEKRLRALEGRPKVTKAKFHRDLKKDVEKETP